MRADGVRSDFLVPDAPPLPAEVRQQGLVPADVSTYAGDLYTARKRLVLLSPLADLQQNSLRHRQAGYAFLPLPAWQRGWTPAQKQWVHDTFAEESPPDPVHLIDPWRRIIAEVQRRSGVPPVICNVFCHVAGRLPHRYFGSPRLTLLERMRQFNLLLAEVSHETGAIVVDLDRALTGFGARSLGTDYELKGDAVAAAAATALVATMSQAGLPDYLSEATS